ncbi:MAG: peptidase S41 [Brevundimonas sp.]|uniref:peptidase S41 n=1 Tax=Brevundimonas sp. TaxID=1871086 RepID=UPI00391BC176
MIILAALTAFATAQDPVPQPADWGAALAEDARAFHDAVAENHAGPVDSENPGFGDLLANGLARALERAETADSYPHWYYALREYEASFDDGHLGLTDWQGMGHRWLLQWPGFMTGLRDSGGVERHEVVFTGDETAPPIGAVLLQCDGRPAGTLATDLLGRTAGRWNLKSQRSRHSANLFIDQMNPYVARPRMCDFQVGGETRTYRLTWRPLSETERDEGRAAARAPRHFAPVEMRVLDQGVWISLGSFESDPATEEGRRLTALTAEVEARADEIRAAPMVVFDLRGNNGGSSLWSSRIARALWGDDRFRALGPRSEGVDWRVSPGNLETIEYYRDVVFADQPEAVTWASEIAEGMRAAMEAAQPLWRQSEDEPSPAAPEGPSPMRGRVYVLTDSGCASACLDAVDFFTAMGAVTAGQETSADSVYMDVRDIPLPSGRVAAYVPMKVYRGRARGNNESVPPAHDWTGDMGDTAAIEAWLVHLTAN